MPRHRVIGCLGALIALLAASAPAAASVDPSQGTLVAATDHGPRPLPLVHTSVHGFVSGALARVEVRQAFDNPFEKPIEAIYAFPLPQDAAVHDMTIRVGDRVVRGLIRRREEARAMYRAARAAGKTAALLDQERPNLFTQSVANILPGARVIVDIEYDVELHYEDGQYSFVFPMTVGPRYIPGAPNGKPLVGHGTSPDTNRVPDASRVTPPLEPPGERSGRDIDLELLIDPGSRTREIYSPTHVITAVASPRHGRNVIRVALAEKKQIPNKDFVVRYRLADTRPAMSVLSHRDQRGGFFTFRFEPPSRPAAGEIAPKELYFVVDTSGSMSGQPLELVKEAMRYAIRNLNPEDTFQIIRFSSSSSRLADRPLAATPQNRGRATKFISDLRTGGGTEMLEGIRAALDEKGSGDRLRVVCFMTDGFIGNETEILGAIERRLGDNTRLFAFGVGSSPNRYLLERMAEAGRGSVHYMLPNEPPAEPIAAFYDRIRAPVLTHIAIDWKGLSVSDVTPAAIPDLFVGQPLALVGRFGATGSATVEVSGRIGGRDVVYRVPVRLEKGGPGSDAIARLWARTRIHALERRRTRGEDTREAITKLGLDYRLMTAFTSFVAVLDQPGAKPGSSHTVVVPTDLPAGMKADGDELEGRLEEQDKKVEDVRVRRLPGAGETAGNAPPAEPEPAPEADYGDADDESKAMPAREYAESIVLTGSSAGGVIGRRWRLGVSLGLGATSGAGDGESPVAGALTLSVDRLVLDGRYAVGPAATLLLRGPENERVVGSFLLQLARRFLLRRLLSPLSLELSLGGGVSLSGERAGIGAMGALELRTRLPIGLQLRYDGAIRFGADDLTTVTLGVKASF